MSVKSILLAAGLTLVLLHPVPPDLQAQQPPAPASPAPPDDPLARLLFPPEMVMRHQGEIGLKPEQRSGITRAIADFQSRVVEVQWRMQEATEKLARLVGQPRVDQAAALAQVDSVLTLEREMKRGHLSLLIQIKNALTPEQQARLTDARGR